MVSMGHGCTGAPWFDENSFAHELIGIESMYDRIPRTSCAPPSNHPYSISSSRSSSSISSRSRSRSRHRSTSPMPGGSETSLRSLSDAYPYPPKTVFDSDELSVEEALLSFLCESPSLSLSLSLSSPDISLASPFCYLPRRDSVELDDWDCLPALPSFGSGENMPVPLPLPVDADVCTTVQAVNRTRTFSSSRLAPITVKSHVLDSSRNAREVAILTFIASIKDKDACPFVQRVNIERCFLDDHDDEPLFDLENHPTSLAHPEVAKQFFLAKDNDNIHALRSLAAELYLALSFIHGHGIVHQDVKPANIMISRDGHAVLGDFGAARFLPSSKQPLRTGLSRPRTIVLEPHDLVTLTPVYAAPELMQRRDDEVLEYDERVDWWSYGLSLYEVVTGRLPFRLQDDLGEDVYDLEVNLIREIYYQLHAFLRLLLVRDPASRLCGPMVKMHPFFDPLSGLWGSIKSLRYPPPCLCPPKLPFFSRPSSLQSISSFDKYDSGSDLPFGSVTILQPRTAYRDSTSSSSSSDDSELSESMINTSPTSPCFLGRRAEALKIRRPTARIFGDFDDSEFSRSPLSEDFDHPLEGARDHIQIGSVRTGRMEPSFSVDTWCSPPQPLPSTCSIVRYHYNDGNGMTDFSPSVPILEVDPTVENLDRFDSSFNDSGLHLPLSESPEAMKWGSLGKPPVIQTNDILETPLLPPRSKPLDQIIDVKWTLDEEIALSLLSAGFVRDRKGAENVSRRRLSRARAVMSASARTMKAMGRRVFLWR